MSIVQMLFSDLKKKKFINTGYKIGWSIELPMFCVLWWFYMSYHFTSYQFWLHNIFGSSRSREFLVECCCWWNKSLQPVPGTCSPISSLSSNNKIFNGCSYRKLKACSRMKERVIIFLKIVWQKPQNTKENNVFWNLTAPSLLLYRRTRNTYNSKTIW